MNLLVTLQPLLVALLSQSAAAGDVIGCGGFIKASRVLDFSRINVELYSKSGSLKYETECAPNNGYFFIPVYEQGTYTIKVAPPLGWQFSPSEVVVDIDGETDACSTNTDINFNFDGFGVVGRVITAGSETGPAGVTISLKSGAGEAAVQTTVTGEDGRYVFTAVPGTDHHVTAAHPSWVFSRDVARVTMTGDNGQAEDLVIAGFDVTGSVVQAGPGGEPMPGVSVLLLTADPAQLHTAQCPDNTPVPGAAPAGLTQLCSIQTDNKGRFVFPVVRPGTYTLLPFYQTAATKFEVSPGWMEVEVAGGSLLLAAPFTVSGFSVSGTVLASAGGKPVAGAEVTLRQEAGEGKVVTVTTDARGGYTVESVVSGSYSLAAASPGLEFAPVTAAVSPSAPVLPQLVAARYEVSGQLDYSTVAHDSAREVVITSSSGRADTRARVETSGGFRVLLPSDTFALSVRPTAVDEQMGIVFAPVTLDISVKDAPVTDIYFSPVRVTVSGSVQCLGACPDLTVTLKPEGFSKDIKMKVKDGKFLFENQLPGSYIAIIHGDGLCFEKDSIPFKIESDPVSSLHFKQTGWVMEVQSSHETVLRFSDADEGQGELDIPIGQSEHCMPAPGPYKLSTAASCHTFFQDAASSSWAAGGGRAVLRAVRHLVSGSVASTETIPDLQMMVTTESKEVHTIALTSPENRDGLFYYK